MRGLIGDGYGGIMNGTPHIYNPGTFHGLMAMSGKGLRVLTSYSTGTYVEWSVYHLIVCSDYLLAKNHAMNLGGFNMKTWQTIAKMV